MGFSVAFIALPDFCGFSLLSLLSWIYYCRGLLYLISDRRPIGKNLAVSNKTYKPDTRRRNFLWNFHGKSQRQNRETFCGISTETSTVLSLGHFVEIPQKVPQFGLCGTFCGISTESSIRTTRRLPLFSIPTVCWCDGLYWPLTNFTNLKWLELYFTIWSFYSANPLSCLQATIILITNLAIWTSIRFVWVVNQFLNLNSLIYNSCTFICI